MPRLPPVTSAALPSMLNRSDTQSPWWQAIRPGKLLAPTGRDPAGVRRRSTDRMDDTASGVWELAVRDRLVARDPSALSDLYDQFGSYVFGLAARVIGDRHAAEDVTQEVFLSMWERPEAFEPARGRLRTFLGTLAHRRAVDVVRREEARRR